MDRRKLRLPFLTLLSAGAMLALGTGAAGAQQAASTDVAVQPPIQLIGLMVQSPDGDRILGHVSDLVIGPDSRVEQAVVTTGAPTHTTERQVVVNSADLRYAPNRQAVVLTGLTPQQFAELPSTPGAERMVALGAPLPRAGARPTNWHGATWTGPAPMPR